MTRTALLLGGPGHGVLAALADDSATVNIAVHTYHARQYAMIAPYDWGRQVRRFRAAEFVAWATGYDWHHCPDWLGVPVDVLEAKANW